MKIKKILSFLGIIALFVLPALARAAEAIQETLTLARVLELAAVNAPEVRLAATRIAEGEAKLKGAQVRTLGKPVMDLATGPRNGTENHIDAEIGIEVPFELSNRRGKRIAVAQAFMQREKLAAADAHRQATAAAVGAYYRVLQAEERLRFVQHRKTFADELFRIAQERHLAGDAAKFEVNLAQTEVVRAASDIAAEQGCLALARTALAKSLGFSSGADIRVEGDLKERIFFDTIRAAPMSRQRIDLAAALADVEVSEANISLAEAEKLPDIAFRISYKREGNENVALGGISFSLPFLNRNSGTIQEAKVLRRRAQIAAEICKTAISAEIEGARLAYDAAVESARRIETEGLILQEENEGLAWEGYRAGKINLSTLLQVRRDALETKREYLVRLLEVAEAGVELAMASGIWSTTN